MLASVVLAAALAAAPAAAGPERSDSVLVVDIRHVASPEHLPGACVVSGVVKAASPGSAYKPGQAFSIPVLCADRRAAIDREPARPMPTQVPLDVTLLKSMRLACAHVGPDGRLDWRVSRKSLAECGEVWGMRPLEAQLLPLAKTPV